MNYLLKSIHYSLFLLLSTCSCLISYAQDDASNKIVDSYSSYTAAPRETIYAHLNKSTYLKGESLAFSAYVVDKNDKKPSRTTTNLYATIEDENNKIVKEQLLLVKNGQASSVFDIDSTFTSGYYTFKAYTNWSLNFSEQLTYAQSIKVIDPKIETTVEKQFVGNKIDAQFLPESGHLLNGVTNTVGVIVKDTLGYGVADLVGNVYDQDKNILTSFKTNQFGISKFPLLAKKSKSYHVVFEYRNKEFTIPLKQTVESTGVVLSVANLRNKVVLSINTNSESLATLNSKGLFLALHNADGIVTSDITFVENTSIKQSFNLEELATGINIFTLFDDQFRPIAERMFFNYNGLQQMEMSQMNARPEKDSLNLDLLYDVSKIGDFGHLSISLLPTATKVYKDSHDIISYIYLQPYINGNIENAHYYFKNVDGKVKYDLDNLLITQGWSSYNWNTIFKGPPSNKKIFEQGISLYGNIAKGRRDKEKTYMLHAMEEQSPLYFTVSENDSVFGADNLFPVDQEDILLSEIVDNKNLKPTSIYLQFFPDNVPTNTKDLAYLKPKPNYNIWSELGNSTKSFEKLNKTTELDEIVVNAQIDKDRVRLQELRKNSFGRIKMLDQSMRNSNLTLADWINLNAMYNADDTNGTLTVLSRGAEPRAPIIYLDNVRLMPFDYASMLYRYPLREIDYIEINSQAMGVSFDTGGGAIKIFTLYETQGFEPSNRERLSKFKLPISFSSNKTYYAPKYIRNNDDFFNYFGAIDWKSDLQLNSQGKVSIKIEKPQVPYTLFIEGMTSTGTYISERVDMKPSDL